ncbi:adenylosuccinate lyase [Anaeramoeba ignava]|uniref:Adenylosuccinate lyase n=1 Tax=Anaeramoeba ignava TaxID=1746090 RepID=A0A9Q0RBZ1_ANAIG|nr:adenylosuccinate lyase [Anaeramoeba ignava]|eukprot:Anaeramoba_ignava/a2166_52.p1 GENE.a2166_52~~a2166_52.p1  ORF type:complete len:432 (+),score=173.16 a2166_52:26-1321(+)
MDWISRYETPISEIFSAENKLKLQIEVELTILKALGEIGKIPKETYSVMKELIEKEPILLERVKEIESEIHHDIMAMVKAIAERSEKYGEYVHFGCTSQDINDTVQALQLVQAKNILLQSILDLKKTLKNLILENQDVVQIGRTHGQHAIPLTVGFKFANFLYEISVAENHLKRTTINIAKLGGAIGTFAALGTKDVQTIALKELGLEPAPISTQVLTRLHLVDFVFSLTTGSCVLERIAKEIRNLQRIEIDEFSEEFIPKQVGSSTMPQKRNPHKSERICGITRLVHAQLNPLIETIALEHERDLTNSVVERVSVSTSVILYHFQLLSLTQILSKLYVNKESIERNLHFLKGKQLAERLMIELTSKIGRQKAHELLRVLSFEKDFEKALREDETIKQIFSEEQIKELLIPETYIGLAKEISLEIAEKFAN